MIMKPPRTCTIDSPCKINLHLKIGEKRPDGFHSLDSLFATLAFGDTLRFESTEKEGECALSMNWDWPEKAIPLEKNLVFRAVSLFREQTGYKNGLRISLDKRIPMGAGLGGGSSNAASSLLALNSLAGNPLSMDKLSKIAASLGSDVPFFLTGGLAYVGGRGELVEFIKFSRKLWVVLIKPSFSSETSYAYKLLDRARAKGILENNGDSLTKTDLIEALERDSDAWPFQNDFLPLFLCNIPTENGEEDRNSLIYKGILDELKEEGASFTGLSGSGSCCFGIFSSKEAAEKAEINLTKKVNHGIDEKGTQKLPPDQTNFVKMTFFLAYRADPVLK